MKTTIPTIGQTWKITQTGRNFKITKIQGDALTIMFLDDYSSQSPVTEKYLANNCEFVTAKYTGISYQIQHGDSGTITGRKGQHSFDSAAEALNEAVEFKNDPRCHNPNMEESNVQYWKTQNFTIIKKTVVTDYLQTI